MSDQERVLVCDCYGDVVKDATVSRWDEHSVRVSAPGYINRTIVLDFADNTPDLVLLLIDPETAKGPGLEEACEMNLACAAKWAALGGGNLKERFLDKVVKTAQDRVYVTVRHGEKLATVLDRTGAWRCVSGRMHRRHEDGYERYPSEGHCSWKTTRGAPDLQVTLWRKDTHDYAALRTATSAEWSYVAELDLDLRTGKGHVFEVARNRLTNRLTNPLLVVQALAWQGLVPFRLEAGA